MLLNRSRFKNETKKLKRKIKEQENLEKILILLKQSKDLISIQNNPFSFLYGFEKLKCDLKGYYSFNLEKNRGKIRLICSFDENNNIVFLEYISLNHYEDFKNYIRENKIKKVNL